MIPEGLTNALSTFQHFMNEVFSDLINISVVVYLDNILIYSNNLAEHRKHVKEVLRRLQKHSLFACTNKCEFHAEQVKYLRYILSPKGLSMDQAVRGTPYASDAHPSSASTPNSHLPSALAPATSSLFRNAFG